MKAGHGLLILGIALFRLLYFILSCPLKSLCATEGHQACHQKRLEKTSALHLDPGIAEMTFLLLRVWPDPDLEEDKACQGMRSFYCLHSHSELAWLSAACLSSVSFWGKSPLFPACSLATTWLLMWSEPLVFLEVLPICIRLFSLLEPCAYKHGFIFSLDRDVHRMSNVWRMRGRTWTLLPFPSENKTLVLSVLVGFVT